MKKRSGLVRVYSAANTFEAHLVKSALTSRNVRTVLRNEDLASLAGALPLHEVMPEVWVPEEDADAALEILDPILRGRSQSGEVSIVALLDDGRLSLTSAPPDQDRVCRRCGETSPSTFDECWSCQTPFETV